MSPETVKWSMQSRLWINNLCLLTSPILVSSTKSKYTTVDSSEEYTHEKCVSSGKRVSGLYLMVGMRVWRAVHGGVLLLRLITHSASMRILL